MWPSQETLKLFVSAEFLTGAAFGIGALALGLVAARVWRHRAPVPVHGLLLTAATMAAMPIAHKIPLRLIAGCVLLAAAGAGFRSVRKIPLAAAASAIPGAVVVAFVTPLPEMGSAIWLVFAIMVVGSPLLATFDMRFREFGLGPVLMTLTVAAAFTVLPETSHIVVMLGVAIPLGILGWPRINAAIGGAGSYALMGMYAWVVASGGEARISSIFGAAAALGVFLAEPLARRFGGAQMVLAMERYPRRSVILSAVFSHAVVLAIAGRLAGTRATALSASIIAIATVVTAAGGIAAMYRGFTGSRPVGISGTEDQGPV